MSRFSRGFSLVETLVAFVVLGLVSTALYRGFIDGSAGTSGALAQYETTEAGRALLEELVVLHSPSDLPTAGTYADHWDWRLTVERRYVPEVTRYRDLGGLFDLRLDVTDPANGTVVTLETTILREMR